MLKYNIRKRKLWVRPIFCDNLNGGSYMVSIYSFPSQIYFVLPSIVWVACHIYHALAFPGYELGSRGIELSWQL
jgi:hypothetical protein